MESKTKDSAFRILMKWASPFSPCTTEEEITLGDMSIEVNGQCLTRNVSNIEKSLRDTIKVSSYPLALWFTTSWWRILYEPAPSGEQLAKSYNWENSHDLTSANSGYIWPAIKFIPDGRFLTVTSSQQFDNSRTPLYYPGLKDALTIDNDTFSSAMKEFIESTVHRLDDLKKRNTDLHLLFEQLSNEINDEDFALYRRIEAILGYDPDEAPDNVINKMQFALKILNENTLTELAAACSVNEAESPVSEIESALAMTKMGIKGKWTYPVSQKEMKKDLPPWDFGRSLARQLRLALGNSSKKIETKTLCDFLGITSTEMTQKQPSHARFTISYFQDDNFYINLKNENSTYYSIGRRFQIARLIGSLLACEGEKVIISSECKTYFQKMQRAFAAEFLAPISEVATFVEKNVTSETIGRAATHFAVSPQTIAHSLANNGVIARGQLNDITL